MALVGGSFTIRGYRLDWRAYLGAVLAACVVIYLRRPASIAHAGLWAEDGPIFVHDAYLMPAVRSIAHPYNGYFHLLLRIWAVATTLLPAAALAVSFAVFNVIVTAVAYSLVLSRRMRWLIPSDALRVVLFAALVLLPGTGEVTDTLTNALWPIAVAFVILALSNAPSTRWGRRAEIAGILVAGLTGPASLLVGPAFLLRWWRERVRHNVVVLGVVWACAAVQALTLLTSHRNHIVGGSFAPRNLARALVLRIWGTLTVGENWLSRHIAHSAGSGLLLVCGIAIVSTALVVWLLPSTARLQWLGIVGLTCAATVWSFNGDLHPLAYTTDAGRYFVVPIVLVVIALIAAIGKVGTRRAVGLVVLAPMALLVAHAMYADFALPRLPSTHWAKSARCIRAHRNCVVRANPPAFKFELPPLRHVR